MPIHDATLDCGARLVVEPIPQVGSAAITWLLPAGIARDPEARVGAAPLFAELLLRGAADLDSRQQADAFDRLGASRNVNTETAHLAVTGTTLGARLDEALPLFADMVRAPRLAPQSLDPARDLCLQAIEGLADDPSERAMVRLRARHVAPPFDRPSIGTAEGLHAINHQHLAQDWNTRAVPNGSIIAVAGNADPRAVTDRLNHILHDWSGNAETLRYPGPGPRGYEHEQDDTNQVHIALAHDAPPEPDPDCWYERLLTAVLSGGMASRLFTEVREKRGLCYSVYASYGASPDYGRTVAYVGTTPDRAQQSLDVLLQQLQRVNTPEGRPTDEEFHRAVTGLKSRLVMSGESTSARAGALARDVHKLGKPRSLEELTDQVDALTPKGLNDYLDRRQLGTLSIVSVGPKPLDPPA